ncbi:MAG: sugar phosphate isomerase/epimerase [Spirochaetae bacterium HGW-Spirochaetae-7]|nr:MAG: sugar phosphate isomerase/epimerase [Spirochaetae bacterium HGW-Spirochaetae-7]
MNDAARFAVHTATTKPWDLETAVRKYAEAGVAGISVWKEALEGHDAAKAGAMIRSAGLSAVSLVRGGFFPAALAAVRRERIRDNERLIRVASALGAPLIVLVCGADPKVRIADARAQVEAGIEVILPFAEAEGVSLAIEPLHPMYAGDRSVINTLAEANDLCERFGSPSLGVAVDVFHVWWDPALEAQIARAGRLGLIKAFHVCDWKTPVLDMLEDRGLMGEGCIDIPLIRGWVEAAGFNGFVEVEIFSRRFWAMDQDAWLRMILGALREHV